MATVNDVILTGAAFQNLFAATGLTVGTAFTIQNKSSSSILVQNLASAPTTGSTNGFVIPSLGFFTVPATYLGLWAFGTGAVGVTA